MPKPTPMNESPDIKGPRDPFEQTRRKSQRVFLKVLNFLKLNETLSEVVERWGSYLQTKESTNQ